MFMGRYRYGPRWIRSDVDADADTDNLTFT